MLLRTVLCLSSFVLWSFEGMSDFNFGLFVFFCDDRSSSRETATPISVSEAGASVAIFCVVELSESSLPGPELADFTTVVDIDSWSWLCSGGMRWDSRVLIRARTERRRRPKGACWLSAASCDKVLHGTRMRG